VGLLEKVNFSYNGSLALEQVTFDSHSGEIIGLIGPNGAGKTTILSLLQGLIVPSAGKVRLFAGNPQLPGSRVRLGCTPQNIALPEVLKVREVVNFVGVHFRNRIPTDEIAEEFGILPFLNRQSGSVVRRSKTGCCRGPGIRGKSLSGARFLCPLRVNVCARCAPMKLPVWG